MPIAVDEDHPNTRAGQQQRGRRTGDACAHDDNVMPGHAATRRFPATRPPDVTRPNR